MKGLFITFEGIEGSGKSTQIALLADYLASLGKSIALTREPGGTLIGDQIRKILLDPVHTMLSPAAELLLYAASRAQHLAEVISPALTAGRIVLCDRFSDATIAYQGYGRGLELSAVRSVIVTKQTMTQPTARANTVLPTRSTIFKKRTLTREIRSVATRITTIAAQNKPQSATKSQK